MVQLSLHILGERAESIGITMMDVIMIPTDKCLGERREHIFSYTERERKDYAWKDRATNKLV